MCSYQKLNGDLFPQTDNISGFAFVRERDKGQVLDHLALLALDHPEFTQAKAFPFHMRDQFNESGNGGREYNSSVKALSGLAYRIGVSL
jgi:hypothetical protein